MGTYDDCPRRYEAEKILGVWSPTGPEAVKGTFVHKVLEETMAHDPEDRTLDVARQEATNAWPWMSNHGDFTRHNFTEAEIRAFKWDAWKSVENYFTMEDPTQIDVVSREGHVNAVIDDVPLRGVIDRLDRTEAGLVVTDYKNGKVPGPKFRTDKYDQLKLYAAMIRAREGELPVKGQLIFTAHSEIIPLEYTPDNVDETIAKAKRIWTEIHSHYANADYTTVIKPQFPATPGGLCGWCPIVEQCPEGMGHATMLFRMKRLKKTASVYDKIARKTPVRMPSRRKRK